MKRLVVILSLAGFIGIGFSSCNKEKCLNCVVEDANGVVINTLAEVCGDDDERDSAESAYNTQYEVGGNDVECQETDKD